MNWEDARLLIELSTSVDYFAVLSPNPKYIGDCEDIIAEVYKWVTSPTNSEWLDYYTTGFVRAAQT